MGEGGKRRTMKMTTATMMAEARERIEAIEPKEAQDLLERDDVVFVDIRDVRELQRDGMIPGAMHCPRGMLEFWADSESPYHKPVFSEDKRFVLYCASSWRSALATDVLQRMGVTPVAHINGGFKAWREAGLPVAEKD